MNSHASRVLARASALGVALVVGLGLSVGGGTANAAVVPTVDLGTAAAYGVLGASTVTNTGPTVVNGLNVGVSPGTAITGFPPGLVTLPGTIHSDDANAADAQASTLTAFNDAAGRSAEPADQGLTDLAGKTLQPGVYQGNLSLTGTVTLDNSTNPNAVFIFQASSTLITAPGSVVTFTDTTHPSCNVFWQVGSSATLGTNSVFVGNILAHTSITANTGAKIDGRLLANTGAVTLDSNTITAPSCDVVTTSSSTPSSSTSTGVTSTSSGSVTVPTGTATSGTGTSATATGTSTGTSTSPPNATITSGTLTLITSTATAPSTNTNTTTRSTRTTGSSTGITTTTRSRTGSITTSTGSSTGLTTSTGSSTGLTTSTAITTGDTTRLTQPSFPTGVPGGVGPTAPTSPLKIAGATLLLLGLGLLLWRNPTVRRRMTGWGRFLAISVKRTGDHR